MLELIQKYQLILSLMKIQTITPPKLGAVLKMMGFNVDSNVVEVLVDVIKTAGEEKQISSLGSLLTQPDIVDQITGVMTEFGTNDTSTASSHRLDSDEEKSSTYSLHKDSLIKCAHCGGLTHLRTAVEKSAAK